MEYFNDTYNFFYFVHFTDRIFIVSFFLINRKENLGFELNFVMTMYINVY